MNETIRQKIIAYLKPASKGLIADDVRVGLGYTSVRLDNGNMGIAWTAAGNSGTCTHQKNAGTLGGSAAEELLDMLASHDNSLSRTIGLATANAVAAGLPPVESTKVDTWQLIDIQSSDKVAMVGFFGPLVPKIRETGCGLDIIELKSDKPGTITPEQGKASLASCSIAIITATSIITGTIDGLLADLGNPRAVVILGPSTFMRPEVFAGTPVTHLAGSRIRDAAAVEKIISEGGGTMIMKPYMDFETVCL